MSTITIAGRVLGPGHPPFTVAECSINHNGSLDLALEMARVAKACGCDCVKFQTFSASGVCPPDQMYTYRSQGHTITEKRINIFRRAELPDSAWPIIKAECDKQGIIFLSTPQNPSDLDLLLKVGIPAIKIGSDDATNLEMLRYCSRDEVGLPVFLSSGMCGGAEIHAALETLGYCDTNMPQIVLMVCASEYPCPPEDVNLTRLTTLRRCYGDRLLLGFSDHTVENTASVMAVALGACVLETHFTLDANLPGPEHCWAREPHRLRAWVRDIREAYTMLGDGIVRPSAAELTNKAQYQRRKTA